MVAKRKVKENMQRKIIVAMASACLLAVSATPSLAGFSDASSTIALWSGSPVNDTVATWYYMGSNLPGGEIVDFVPGTVGGAGFDIQGNGGFLAGTTYYLNYKVTLDNAAAYFTGVSINTDPPAIPPSTDSLTKTIALPNGSTVTLTSLNGVPSFAPLLGKPGTLIVHEVLNVTSGAVTGFGDTYTVVPEPTTIASAALLMLLPLGASAARVLRRK